MNFIEGGLHLLSASRKNRSKDPANPWQRKRSEAAIFADGRHAVMTARRDQRQPATAPSDRDNVPDLRDFVQPALAHLATRLRSAFNQTRTRAGESFHGPHCGNRQIESGFCESLPDHLFVFSAALLELLHSRQQISIGKAALRDRADVAK